MTKRYFAYTDALGFPVPGTMFGSNRAICKCDVVELLQCDKLTVDSSTQDVSTIVRRKHPKKLRFFYKIKCTGGPAIPNSLIASIKHPGKGYIEVISTKCC